MGNSKIQNKIVLIFLFLFTTSIISFAQTTVTPRTRDTENFLGALKDGIYRNDYFKFSMGVSSEFFVLTEGEINVSKNSGAKILSGDVKGNRGAFEKAALKEVILIAITEKSPGSADNSTLAIGALRQPDGVSPRMVANTAKDFLLRNPNVRLVKDTVQVKLAKQAFSLFEFSSNINGQALRFKYYAMIRKGHSLTFVITYLTDDSREKFEKVLSTLAFDLK